MGFSSHGNSETQCTLGTLAPIKHFRAGCIVSLTLRPKQGYLTMEWPNLCKIMQTQHNYSSTALLFYLGKNSSLEKDVLILQTFFVVPIGRRGPLQIRGRFVIIATRFLIRRGRRFLALVCSKMDFRIYFFVMKWFE